MSAFLDHKQLQGRNPLIKAFYFIPHMLLYPIRLTFQYSFGTNPTSYPNIVIFFCFLQNEMKLFYPFYLIKIILLKMKH